MNNPHLSLPLLFVLRCCVGLLLLFGSFEACFLLGFRSCGVEDVFFFLKFLSRVLHIPEVGRLIECRSAKLYVQRLMCEHADRTKDFWLFELFWCSFSDSFQLKVKGY